MTARVRLLVTEAWNSLRANASTTLAATMTVLIGMFLLGLFIAFGTWTVSWSDHVKRQLQVRVFFLDTSTLAEKNALARRLQQDPYVSRAKGGLQYVSKEQALNEMSRRFPDLTRGLSANPLPASFRITPDKPEDVNLLYDSIVKPKLPAGVQKVERGKKTSDKILRFAHVIEWVFIAATIVLVGASILLISNTIRLSIFSRRREIEVMKLVGATNWFIRGPFMLEGLITGFVGALFALLLLLIARLAILPSLDWANAGPDVHAWAPGVVSLILVGMGLVLGAVGSGLTIRRFLKV